MEVKIQKHIRKEHSEKVFEYLKWMCCNHKWKKHIGYGYKCQICGYYTWLDSTLNRLIEKFLTTKDK